MKVRFAALICPKDNKLEMLKDHTDGKTFDKLKEKFAV
jgi:hypothetical protein